MAKWNQILGTWLALVGKALAAAWSVVYALALVIGEQTAVAFGLLWQWMKRPLRAVGRFFRRLFDRMVLRRVHTLQKAWHRFAHGFSLARERVGSARARGVWVTALQVLALPLLAARRHKRGLCRLANWLAPVAAAFVLLAVVNYWSGLSFGLELEYEGQRLGYITDASVFENAAAMVNSRVCADDSGSLQVRPPKLTLAVVTEAQVLDEATLCDKIIESSGDAFAEGVGLYVDGELIGALATLDEVQAALDEHMNAYRVGGLAATFVQEVKTEQGLYPVGTVMTAEMLKNRLAAAQSTLRTYTVKKGDTLSSLATAFGTTVRELQRVNRLEGESLKVGQELRVQVAARRLQVQCAVLDGYEETIRYTTRTVEDPNAYEGTRKVRVKGQNGTRFVTTETRFVDGLEQETVITGKTVTRKPVEEVIAIGTKKRAPDSVYTPNTPIVNGDGVNTGRMTWPVPAVRCISQRFHGGHGAIDIANGPVTMQGTPIVAADGGVVTVVNTNRHAGYGLYIVIDHGNGITTLYAHLDSLSVTVGQKVTRGQEIGRGGNTGWSEGPHLHFEVRVNGRCQNPLNFVSTSS